jgi:predicted nucleic acid-binding protein
MIVADNSVLVAFWLPGACTELAEAVKLRDSVWAAPILWRAEFRAVLTAHLRKGLLTEAEANTAYSNAQRDLGEREFTVPTERVLRLALGSDCTAFECEYAALAVDLTAALVTANEKILRAFPKIAVSMADFARKKE